MADKKVSDLPSLNGADVDPADLLYIVDSSAGAAGSKKITVGQYQLAPVSGGTANTVVYLNGSKVESSSSALTFDGTNLGVGTSSPAQRLDVTGAVNSVQARFGNVAGRGLEIGTSIISGTNDAGSVLNAKGATSGTMIFQTDSTERMRLDSSGNLGIGTSSPGVKLEVAGDARLTGANPSLSAVPTSTGFFIDNRSVGKSTFFRVSSASAIDTTAATIDSSGNLGLGVTPSAWSVIKAIEIGGFRNSIFSDNGSVSVGIASGSYYNAGWKYALTGSAVGRYELAGNEHRWFTAPSGTAGNAITFTQSMTLDASGNLLVGTTTTSGAGGITLFNNGSTGFSFVNNNNASATGYVFSSYRRSSIEIGSVTQNGTTAVLFNTTSDRRLKNNIVPAPSASAVIDAIEIVSHDWKSAPDEHVTYGVIAQDLALVAPQAVLQGDDGDEIEKAWGVDYSKLVPMLIKEIQSLRARVAALEAK